MITVSTSALLYCRYKKLAWVLDIIPTGQTSLQITSYRSLHLYEYTLHLSTINLSTELLALYCAIYSEYHKVKHLSCTQPPHRLDATYHTEDQHRVQYTNHRSSWIVLSTGYLQRQCMDIDWIVTALDGITSSIGE